MSSPSCFCAFATKNISYEVGYFLKSLSLFHPNANIVFYADSYIKTYIDSIQSELLLQIDIHESLNQFSNETRPSMEQKGIWKEFQSLKSNIISYCLTKYSDVLYLDVDILMINPFILPEKTTDKYYDLILSPHYISKKTTDTYGYYNGGCIWTSNPSFPDIWNGYTKTSRFFEQASLENCVADFNTGFFGENYNVSWWRMEQSDEPQEKMYKYIEITKDNVFFKGKPIIFLHTHFKDRRYMVFNDIMKQILSACPLKKHLISFL